ncbi:N-acetyltransferase [Streptomyces badius]
MAGVPLRAVEDADLPLFFAWIGDPDATRVAAFTPEDPTDRAAFDAHWAQDPVRIRRRGDAHGGGRRGPGGPCRGVRGGRRPPGDALRSPSAHWGRGLATAALRAFLDETPTRPLHARAAADNLGSRRVLEKCGFVVTGTDRGFAQARGEEIDEVLVTLRA